MRRSIDGLKGWRYYRRRMPQPKKGAKRPRSSPSSASVPADGNSKQPPAGLGELSFEASLESLEGVVDQLERGELELEASLAAFEQGVQLSARCSSLLASAEQRIETLTQDGGNWLSRPFEHDSGDPADSGNLGDPASDAGSSDAAVGTPGEPADGET